MNAYELGATDADDEVGAMVITPGTMLDEMETVNIAIRDLRNSIALSSVRKDFKDVFAAFAGEWQRFYADHKSWFDRMWSATYEKILDYRRRAEEWRQAFIREGGNPAGPAVVSPQATSHAGPAFWLIGAGLGAWALSSIASFARK